MRDGRLFPEREAQRVKDSYEQFPEGRESHKILFLLPLARTVQTSDHAATRPRLPLRKLIPIPSTCSACFLPLCSSKGPSSGWCQVVSGRRRECCPPVWRLRAPSSVPPWLGSSSGPWLQTPPTPTVQCHVVTSPAQV